VEGGGGCREKVMIEPFRGGYFGGKEKEIFKVFLEGGSRAGGVVSQKNLLSWKEKKGTEVPKKKGGGYKGLKKTSGEGPIQKKI